MSRRNLRSGLLRGSGSSFYQRRTGRDEPGRSEYGFGSRGGIFRVFYVFLVLRHDRRRVVHFNVTTNPTPQWAAQRIVEAFPFEDKPRFLLRDRDGIYGQCFRDRVEHMGIEEVIIAPRHPWQNPYAERVIGSIRRECMDHVIILNEDHLRRILSEYFAYYHEARAHLSLDCNSPDPRRVQPAQSGKVVAKAYLGGRHHYYSRAA